MSENALKMFRILRHLNSMKSLALFFAAYHFVIEKKKPLGKSSLPSLVDLQSRGESEKVSTMLDFYFSTASCTNIFKFVLCKVSTKL